MTTIRAELAITEEEGIARWKDTAAATLRPSPFLISEEPVVLATDEGAVLMQMRLDERTIAQLRQALMAFPLHHVVRGAGIRNRAQVFGYLARSAMMQRYACRASVAASAAPKAHAFLCDLAAELASMLRQVLPERWEANHVAALAVLPDWRLPGGLWTSGVVNRSSTLPYHRDRNNLTDAWSAMPVIRRGVRGGHLHLPELMVDGEPVVLPCRDGDVVFFNGQRYMHGVTPMKYAMKDGYRYSAVYYPVAKMRSCLAAEVELARAQRERTASEDTLVARQRESGYLAAEAAGTDGGGFVSDRSAWRLPVDARFPRGEEEDLEVHP